MTNPLAPDLDHVLEHTRDVWEELRGERIFMTGGTGFIGCWLLETFLWANARLGLKASMTVLSRNPEAFRRKAPHLAGDPALELVTGDVRDFAFPGGQFSHVIHGAAESSVKLNEERPLEMFDIIAGGTRRVLDFAVSCDARKLLLISSGAVYGKQPSAIERVEETYAGAPDPMDPRSSYGEAKRAAELLCAIYSRAHGIEAKIARCFAFVGPYLPLDSHFAIGNFIRDALAGGPIRIKSDGTAVRSYLYAADLAVWLWTILFRGESCVPYNVGDERPASILDAAKEVAAAANSAASVRVDARPASDVTISHYVPSTERARRDLRLQARVPLRDALVRTLRWLDASASRDVPSSPGRRQTDVGRLARAIRGHALRMVHTANASHIGGCLSAADILAALYGQVLSVHPSTPDAEDRDRFLLSKGHAAAALYAVLAERGFFSRSVLGTFCADGSLLTGHASHLVPGVEFSSGSLGHGLPVACGIALSLLNSSKKPRVFVLMSDGELDEGSNWEAALFASQHRLGNLLAIIDVNGLQGFGRTEDILSLEPLRAKWEAFGWRCLEVDGHDCAEIAAGLAQPARNRRPTVVIARTLKGRGVSFMEGELAWHYKSPKADQLRIALEEVENRP
jgi:transketolase N-terminal domain/subunit/nucleoside-diphosphate-sugar epimerase